MKLTLLVCYASDKDEQNTEGQETSLVILLYSVEAQLDNLIR
jgi:hypothetical protein